MGGTPNRMEDFAKYIQTELNYSTIKDYSSKRYAFYKVLYIFKFIKTNFKKIYKILLKKAKKI